MALLEANQGKAWIIAATLTAQREIYYARNKPALAEDVWTRAMKMDTGVFGEDDPQVACIQMACIMEKLVAVYGGRKGFILARRYAEHAAEVMRMSCSAQSVALASALAVRAGVEVNAQAYDAAAAQYQQALAIARTHPESPLMADRIMQRYAGLLRSIHRNREAKALQIEAKAFRGKQ